MRNLLLGGHVIGGCAAAFLAFAAGSSAQAAQSLGAVTTNAADFVWIGADSAAYAGFDPSAGTVTDARQVFAGAGEWGGAHVISNDLTISSGIVRFLGRNLTSWSQTNYQADLAAGKAPILAVGPAAGSGDETVTVTVGHPAGLIAGYRNSKSVGDPDGNARNTYVTVTNGANGGYAKFVVNGFADYSGYNATYGIWFEHFILSKNATPRAGETTIDFLELGKTDSVQGRSLIQEFRNLSDYDARILFKGGRFDLWYIGCGNAYTPIYADNGKSLILESVDGAPVDLYKQAKPADVCSGTVKVVGSGDFKLGSNSYLTLQESTAGSGVYDKPQNNLPWTLTASSSLDWSDFTGDIVLYGGGSALRLQGDDQLPWGPGKGRLVVSQETWNNSTTGGRIDHSALLVDEGKRVRLNGLVRGGKYGQYSYVSNTTAAIATKYSQIVLGDGNTDGQLSIIVTPKVEIVKEGSGTLLVSGTTFAPGSRLTVKAGTVVFPEDQALPEDCTVAEGATIVRERVIDVASGTSACGDLIADGAAKLRVRKTGAGSLTLSNGANTFSGGLVVDEGVVSITAAGAQGSGKITVNASSAKTCQIRFATAPASASATVEYPNDIVVTGKSTECVNGSSTFTYAAISLAQTNQVLNGSISAADDLYIRDDATFVPGGAGDLQNISCLTCNGPITVAPGHALYLTVGSKQYYKGAISADELRIPMNSGYRASAYLQAANRIGRIVLSPRSNSPKLFVSGSGRVDGAVLEFDDVNIDKQCDIRGTFEPVVDTTLASIQGPDFCRPGDADDTTAKKQGGNAIGCNVGDSCTSTLTLVGRDDVDETKFCGVFGGVKTSFALAARAAFTQVLSNVWYCGSGTLTVTGGTLVVAGKSYFKNLTSIVVGGTGVLDIRGLGLVSTETTDGFPNLQTLRLSSTARLRLAPDVTIRADSVTLDGLPVKAGTYSGGLPGLSGGTLVAGSNYGPVVMKTWSGGAGADTSTETAANWADGKAPHVCTVFGADFGTGGSRATFPAGENVLGALALTRDGGFTLDGVSGASLTLVGSQPVAVDGGEADEGEGKPAATYEIALPCALGASQDWWIPTNRTLRIAHSLTAANGVSSVDVVKHGYGTLELADARFPGNLTSRDGGWLKLSGDVGSAGEDGTVTFKNFTLGSKQPDGSYASWGDAYLYLDNVTMYKKMHFDTSGSVTGARTVESWLNMPAGARNVFKEVVIQGGSSAWLLDNDSTLVFEKGYCDAMALNPKSSNGGGFTPGMKAGCTNGTMVFKGPLRLVKPDKGTLTVRNSANLGLTLAFESTGNVCTNYLQFNCFKTEFRVDDAFTSTPLFVMSANSGTVLDLTTTHQSIPCVKTAVGSGTIRGEYPSTLEITKGLASEADVAKTNFCPLAVNGGAGLKMSGDGWLVIGDPTGSKAFDYQSCGDIEVTNGTMEFLPRTTWLHGTNVTVRGAGTLKLGGETFCREAVVNVSDQGKIEIAAGVVQSCAKAFLNGAQLMPGRYTKNSKVKVVTGDGALRVRGSFLVIVR